MDTVTILFLVPIAGIIFLCGVLAGMKLTRAIFESED